MAFFKFRVRILLLFNLVLITKLSLAQWTSSDPFQGDLIKSSITFEGKIFVGTATQGIFISNDNGITWNRSNTGLTNTSITSFAKLDAELFVGTWGGGVFKSSNNGQSWVSSNSGLTNPFVQTLLSSGNNLFAGIDGCFGCNGSGVYISTDRGESWSASNNGIGSTSIKSLASIGSYIFAGSQGAGIFRSSDNGLLWVPVNSNINLMVNKIIEDGNYLFAATPRGVYRSNDLGISWYEINSGLLNSYTNLPNPIYSLASSGNNLFAGSSNKIFRSTNKGISWSEVNSSAFNTQFIFISNNFVFACASNGLYTKSLLDFPTINSFSPSSGIIGSVVTIKGSGFSEIPNENIVIVGNESTTATNSSFDSLTFIIPPSSQSSTISVVVNSILTTHPDSLKIIPNITKFYPESGPPRSLLTIEGTGFGMESLVTIDEKKAWVKESSTNGIIVMVPDIVSSAKIKINHKGTVGISATPFIAAPSAPLPDPGGFGSIIWSQPISAGFICHSMAIDFNNDLFFTGQSANYHPNNRNYFNNTPLPNTFDSYLIKSDTLYNIKWKKVINSGILQPIRIATDNDNNLILVGAFAKSVIIDSEEIISFDYLTKGVYVVKLNGLNGDLMWYNYMLADPYTYINDIKIEDNGNIYLAGSGSGFTEFYNNNILTKSIDSSINTTFGFIAHYNYNGTLNWVKSFTQGNSIIVKSIEVDKEKNIYISGTWYGGGTFESVTKVSTSGDIFIAKLDSIRNLSWLKQIGANYNDTEESGYALALDEKLKCIYVTGNFVKGNFGNGEIQAEDNNIFLARYTLDGDLIWVKKMGSFSGSASFTEVGNQLIVDQDGFVYLGGVIGPVSTGQGFDGVVLKAYRDPSNSNFYNDAFIAKYTALGTLLWAHHFGDPNYDDYLTSILKDKSNKLYFTGSAGGNSIFGTYIPQYMALPGFVSSIKDQKEDILEISQNSFTIEADKNLKRSFDIISNKEWSQSSNDDWFTISLTNGKGNSQITLIVQKNVTSSERTGKIIISSTNSLKKIELNVKQFKSTDPEIITSILQGNDAQMIVYPNPANQSINIKSELDLEGNQIEIYDMSGRIVLKSILENNQIDVRSLSTGIYILKVKTMQGQSITRFSIQ